MRTNLDEIFGRVQILSDVSLITLGFSGGTVKAALTKSVNEIKAPSDNSRSVHGLINQCLSNRAKPKLDAPREPGTVGII